MAINLQEAVIDKEYRVVEIIADDDELVSFLFSLGCYEGQNITVISALGDLLVLSIKDARYSIDKDLAEAIIVE